jgi:predicted nuclease of predicted toxin-antitoxin system
MIRFLLDEHVPHAIARGLRLRGVDVLTLADAELISRSDVAILEYALEEQLVVFSQDDDFLRLAAAGNSHAGIVYCSQGKHAVGELVQLLKLISDCFESSDMFGQIEYL